MLCFLPPELVRVAQHNAARLNVQKVRFVCADATEFTGLDDFTHIYMYNPFPNICMARVMANLAASVARSNHHRTLIYKNPVCHGVIVQSGLFSVDRDYRFGNDLNDTFRVYSSALSLLCGC